MVEHVHMGAIRLKNGRPQILHEIQYKEGCLVLRWEDYAKYILSVYFTGKNPTEYTAFIKFVDEKFPDGESQVIIVQKEV